MTALEQQRCRALLSFGLSGMRIAPMHVMASFTNIDRFDLSAPFHLPHDTEARRDHA